VRLKVIAALDRIAEAVGADVVGSTLLPSIEALGSDSQWRVRQVVLDQLPLLAATLGPAVFSSRLFTLFCNGLEDKVAEVRKSAALNIRPLCDSLGGPWAASVLVPKLTDMHDGADNYLARITVLYSIAALASAKEGAVALPKLVRMVEAAAKDRVPNVRFVGIRAARSVLVNIADAGISSSCRAAIAGLASDTDKDVSFFAKEALTVGA
jgi:serine/threonine-protein phosphatase 2A regulatory subunit A